MAKERKIILCFLLITLGVWAVAIAIRPTGPINYGQVTVVSALDQSESMEHPLFIKTVYEPVIPEGSNIASEAKIEANGFNDVYVPRKVKDGKTNGVSYWEGEADAYPNILTATFEEEKTIHAIKVCLNPQTIWGPRTQTFSVEISTDGENYSELIASADYDFDPATANEVVLEFNPVTLRGIRLAFTANTGATGAQVAEFEIYSDQ